MSRTKKLLPLSLVASLLLFTACGGGNSSPQSVDSKDKVSVPQKISIDIPDALKSKRENSTVNKLSNSEMVAIDTPPTMTNSYGYQQLQNTINQAEETISDVKGNLVYLNKMMPDIISACQDTPKNETCHIEKDTIKITIEGHSLSMGKIAYTEQDSSKKYQHTVVLDLQPTLESMGESVSKELETIKWSADENHIETFSDAQFENSTYTMQLHYDKMENGASKMIITDNFSDKEIKGNFTLKLNDQNDANHTVNIETTGSIQMAEESDAFSSEGTVSDKGGYLISKGSFFSEKFAEKEVFDATGKLLQSSFCHNNDESGCTISDPNSWIKFDEAEGGKVEEFTDSTFDDSFPEDIEVNFQEPTELTFSQSENFPTFTYCEILPSDYNTSSLKEEDVYNQSIGSFARFEDDLFGILLENKEKEHLNTLPIACNSSEKMDFSLISEDIRPIIEVKE